MWGRGAARQRAVILGLSAWAFLALGLIFLVLLSKRT